MAALGFVQLIFLVIDNDIAVLYSKYPVTGGGNLLVDLYDAVDADFIWSDNSDGYNHAYDLGNTDLTDWTNGYLIKNLPSDYQTLTR